VQLNLTFKSNRYPQLTDTAGGVCVYGVSLFQGITSLYHGCSIRFRCFTVSAVIMGRLSNVKSSVITSLIVENIDSMLTDFIDCLNSVISLAL